jgi:hypothetical protein
MVASNDFVDLIYHNRQAKSATLRDFFSTLLELPPLKYPLSNSPSAKFLLGRQASVILLMPSFFFIKNVIYQSTLRAVLLRFENIQKNKECKLSLLTNFKDHANILEFIIILMVFHMEYNVART